jgi:hypothetical protein
MYNLLLILNCMVKDYLQPSFTDMQFGNWIVFDDLEDEVIGTDEDNLECIIFCFLFFIYFI